MWVRRAWGGGANPPHQLTILQAHPVRNLLLRVWGVHYCIIDPIGGLTRADALCLEDYIRAALFLRYNDRVDEWWVRQRSGEEEERVVFVI